MIHLPYILAAYLASAATLLGMAVWIAFDSPSARRILDSRRFGCMGGGIDWRFNNGTRLGPELVGLVYVGKIDAALAKESGQPEGSYEFIVDEEKGGCYGKLTPYPYKHSC